MLLIFLVLAVIVVALLWGMYKTLSKYEEVRTNYDKRLFEANTKAEEQLAEAEKEAKNILDDARIKSQKLVSDAEGFSVNGSRKLQEALDWMLKDQTRAFTDEMKIAREQTEKKLLSVADEVNQMAATELKVFANKLQEQTKTAQVEAQQTIAQVYAGMGEELEQYKQARMKVVDEVVRDMVMRVGREVMGETIASSEHEALVVKALEEAKKRNVI
jgi:vacuolar-type H+-ATPase subunit H